MEYVLQTKLLPFLLINVLRDMYLGMQLLCGQSTIMHSTICSSTRWLLACFTFRTVYLPGIHVCSRRALNVAGIPR